MIQPTDNSRTPVPIGSAKAQTAKAEAKSEPGLDRLEVEMFQSFREAVSGEPAIRPEVVEMGRKLSADPDYPPAHVVVKLAALLANEFEEEAN